LSPGNLCDTIQRETTQGGEADEEAQYLAAIAGGKSVGDVPAHDG
jgi:hypothetical protein